MRHLNANNRTNFIRQRDPLSMDQIRKAAPSAFALEKYAETSDRYRYIPTANVIEFLMQRGFMPFQASQSLARIEGRKEFTKHMIRFRTSATSQLAVGDTFPEIVLINAHDRSAAWKMMGGLFRLVCGNGMVVADSLVGSASIRHSGNAGRIIEDVHSAAVEIVGHMPKVIDAVARWQQIQLDRAEQEILAKQAHFLRFSDSEGKVNTPIQATKLLAPRRPQDQGDDLWSTFNRVQEHVIQGGDTVINPTTQRRTTSRRVKGIDQDVKLNRALWALGEEMAKLKRGTAA